MDLFTRSYLFPVRPRHLETMDSYSIRLLAANFETLAHKRFLTRLAENASDAAGANPEAAWSRVVQAKTGRDVTRLLDSGVTDVGHPDGSNCPGCTDGILNRYMCTLCAHGEHVQQHPHFDTNVCVQHRRWVGPSTQPDQQLTGGHDLVQAELEFRKLRRSGLIDVAAYFALRRILSPLAESTGATGSKADMLMYPVLIRLTRVLTGVDFGRKFFDPNHTYAESFRFLAGTLEGIIGKGHEAVARHLWLYLRPAFLNIRESLDSGGAYKPASPHDFPLRPSMISGFRAPIRPLEPFSRYLEPTGDDTITPQNYLTVLAHYGAPQHPDNTRAIPTICRLGHRVNRRPVLMQQHALQRVEHCTVCDHRTLLRGYNDMATTAPQHAAEFDLEANYPLTPQDVFAGSPTSYHWKCRVDENHRFPATASNRTAAHSGCPLCLGRLVVPQVNDADSFAPHLTAELHPTKNGEVKLCDLWVNSTTVLWWICESCHTFRDSVRNRTAGSSCHHCATKKSGARTITNARPDLAVEFDRERNYPRTPEDVKIGSKTEYFWICPRNHSYKQRPERRNAGYGCSTCSNRRLDSGFNDAATKYPIICTEWHPYLNMIEPSEILPGTKLYFWECKANNHVEQQSTPHRVLSKGCTKCDPSDRIGFPEQ